MAAFSTGTPIVKVYHDKSMILPDVSRVLACLYEKDIKFERQTASSYKGLLRLQALNHAPVPFYDGPTTFLEESREICRYIAETYEHHGYPFLLGKDSLERASIEQWLHHEEHAFNPPSRSLFCHLAFRLDEEDDDVDLQKRKLDEVLEIYEQRLSDTEFLAGNKFSLADLVHLPNSHYITTSDKFVYLYDSRKNVQRWWNAISTRDSWQKVLKDIKKVEQQRDQDEFEKQQQQQWQREHPTPTGRQIQLHHRKHTGTKSQTILVPPPVGVISTSPIAPQAEKPLPSEIPLDETPTSSPSTPSSHKSSVVQSKQATIFPTHISTPQASDRSTPRIPEKSPVSSQRKINFFTPLTSPATADKPPKIGADNSSIRDVSIPSEAIQADLPTKSKPSSSKEVSTNLHMLNFYKANSRIDEAGPGIEPTPQETSETLDKFSETDGPSDATVQAKISPSSANEDPDQLRASMTMSDDSQDKESVRYTDHTPQRPAEIIYGRYNTQRGTDTSPGKLLSTEAHQELKAEQWHAATAGLTNLKGETDHIRPTQQVKHRKDVQQYSSQDSKQPSTHPRAQESGSMDGQLAQGPEMTTRMPHTDQRRDVSSMLWQRAADIRGISDDEASSDHRGAGLPPYTRRIAEAPKIVPADRRKDAPLQKRARDDYSQAAPFQTAYDDPHDTTQEAIETTSAPRQTRAEAHDTSVGTGTYNSITPRSQPTNVSHDAVPPSKKAAFEGHYHATTPYPGAQDLTKEARESHASRPTVPQDAQESTDTEETVKSSSSEAQLLDSRLLDSFPPKKFLDEDGHGVPPLQTQYADDQHNKKQDRYPSASRKMVAQDAHDAFKETNIAAETLDYRQADALPRRQPPAKDPHTSTSPFQKRYLGDEDTAKQPRPRNMAAEEVQNNSEETKPGDSWSSREQPSDTWQAPGPLPRHEVDDARSTTTPFWGTHTHTRGTAKEAEDVTSMPRRKAGEDTKGTFEEIKFDESASFRDQPLDYQRTNDPSRKQEAIEHPLGATSQPRKRYADVEGTSKHSRDTSFKPKKMEGGDVQDTSEEADAHNSLLAQHLDAWRVATTPSNQEGAEDALGMSRPPTRYARAEETSKQPRAVASTPTQDARDTLRESNIADSSSSIEKPSDARALVPLSNKKVNAERYLDTEGHIKEGKDTLEEAKNLDSASSQVQPLKSQGADAQSRKKEAVEDPLRTISPFRKRHSDVEETTKQFRENNFKRDKIVGHDAQGNQVETEAGDFILPRKQPSDTWQAAATPTPNEASQDDSSLTPPSEKRSPTNEETSKKPRAVASIPTHIAAQDARDALRESNIPDSSSSIDQPSDARALVPLPNKKVHNAQRYPDTEGNMNKGEDTLEEAKNIDSASSQVQPLKSQGADAQSQKKEVAEDRLRATSPFRKRHPDVEETTKQSMENNFKQGKIVSHDAQGTQVETEAGDFVLPRDQPSDTWQAAATPTQNEATQDGSRLTPPTEKRYPSNEEIIDQPRGAVSTPRKQPLSAWQPSVTPRRQEIGDSHDTTAASQKTNPSESRPKKASDTAFTPRKVGNEDTKYISKNTKVADSASPGAKPTYTPRAALPLPDQEKDEEHARDKGGESREAISAPKKMLSRDSQYAPVGIKTIGSKSREQSLDHAQASSLSRETAPEDATDATRGARESLVDETKNSQDFKGTTKKSESTLQGPRSRLPTTQSFGAQDPQRTDGSFRTPSGELWKDVSTQLQSDIEDIYKQPNSSSGHQKGLGSPLSQAEAGNEDQAITGEKIFSDSQVTSSKTQPTDSQDPIKVNKMPSVYQEDPLVARDHHEEAQTLSTGERADGSIPKRRQAPVVISTSEEKSTASAPPKGKVHDDHSAEDPSKRGTVVHRKEATPLLVQEPPFQVQHGTEMLQERVDDGDTSSKLSTIDQWRRVSTPSQDVTPNSGDNELGVSNMDQKPTPMSQKEILSAQDAKEMIKSFPDKIVEQPAPTRAETSDGQRAPPSLPGTANSGDNELGVSSIDQKPTPMSQIEILSAQDANVMIKSSPDKIVEQPAPTRAQTSDDQRAPPLLPGAARDERPGVSVQMQAPTFTARPRAAADTREAGDQELVKTSDGLISKVSKATDDSAIVSEDVRDTSLSANNDISESKTATSNANEAQSSGTWPDSISTPVNARLSTDDKFRRFLHDKGSQPPESAQAQTPLEARSDSASTQNVPSDLLQVTKFGKLTSTEGIAPTAEPASTLEAQLDVPLRAEADHPEYKLAPSDKISAHAAEPLPSVELESLKEDASISAADQTKTPQTTFRQQTRPPAPITRELPSADTRHDMKKIQEVTLDNLITNDSAKPYVRPTSGDRPSILPGKGAESPTATQATNSEDLRNSASIQDRPVNAFDNFKKPGRHSTEQEAISSMADQASSEISPAAKKFAPSDQDLVNSVKQPSLVETRKEKTAVSAMEQTLPTAIDQQDTRGRREGPTSDIQHFLPEQKFAPSDQDVTHTSQLPSSIERMNQEIKDPVRYSQPLNSVVPDQIKKFKTVNQQDISEAPGISKSPTSGTHHAPGKFHNVAPDGHHIDKSTEQEAISFTPVQATNLDTQLDSARGEVLPAAKKFAPSDQDSINYAQRPSMAETRKEETVISAAEQILPRVIGQQDTQGTREAPTSDTQHALPEQKIATSVDPLFYINNLEQDSAHSRQQPSSAEPTNEEIKDSAHSAQPLSALPDQTKKSTSVGQQDISLASETSESPCSESLSVVEAREEEPQPIIGQQDTRNAPGISEPMNYDDHNKKFVRRNGQFYHFQRDSEPQEVSPPDVQDVKRITSLSQTKISDPQHYSLPASVDVDLSSGNPSTLDTREAGDQEFLNSSDGQIPKASKAMHDSDVIHEDVRDTSLSTNDDIADSKTATSNANEAQGSGTWPDSTPAPSNVRLATDDDFRRFLRDKRAQPPESAQAQTPPETLSDSVAAPNVPSDVLKRTKFGKTTSTEDIASAATSSSTLETQLAAPLRAEADHPENKLAPSDKRTARAAEPLPSVELESSKEDASVSAADQTKTPQTVFRQQTRPPAPITREVPSADTRHDMKKIQEVTRDNIITDDSAKPYVRPTSGDKPGILPDQDLVNSVKQPSSVEVKKEKAVTAAVEETLPTTIGRIDTRGTREAPVSDIQYSLPEQKFAPSDQNLSQTTQLPSSTERMDEETKDSAGSSQPLNYSVPDQIKKPMTIGQQDISHAPGISKSISSGAHHAPGKFQAVASDAHHIDNSIPSQGKISRLKPDFEPSEVPDHHVHSAINEKTSRPPPSQAQSSDSKPDSTQNNNDERPIRFLPNQIAQQREETRPPTLPMGLNLAQGVPADALGNVKSLEPPLIDQEATTPRVASDLTPGTVHSIVPEEVDLTKQKLFLKDQDIALPPALDNTRGPPSDSQSAMWKIQEINPEVQHIDGPIPSQEQVPRKGLTPDPHGAIVQEPNTHTTGSKSAPYTQQDMVQDKDSDRGSQTPASAESTEEATDPIASDQNMAQQTTFGHQAIMPAPGTNKASGEVLEVGPSVDQSSELTKPPSSQKHDSHAGQSEPYEGPTPDLSDVIGEKTQSPLVSQTHSVEAGSNSSANDDVHPTSHDEPVTELRRQPEMQPAPVFQASLPSKSSADAFGKVEPLEATGEVTPADQSIAPSETFSPVESRKEESTVVEAKQSKSSQPIIGQHDAGHVSEISEPLFDDDRSKELVSWKEQVSHDQRASESHEASTLNDQHASEPHEASTLNDQHASPIPTDQTKKYTTVGQRDISPATGTLESPSSEPLSIVESRKEDSQPIIGHQDTWNAPGVSEPMLDDDHNKKSVSRNGQVYQYQHASEPDEISPPDVQGAKRITTPSQEKNSNPQSDSLQASVDVDPSNGHQSTTRSSPDQWAQLSERTKSPPLLEASIYSESAQDVPKSSTLPSAAREVLSSTVVPAPSPDTRLGTESGQDLTRFAQPPLLDEPTKEATTVAASDQTTDGRTIIGKQEEMPATDKGKAPFSESYTQHALTKSQERTPHDGLPDESVPGQEQASLAEHVSEPRGGRNTDSHGASVGESIITSPYSQEKLSEAESDSGLTRPAIRPSSDDETAIRTIPEQGVQKPVVAQDVSFDSYGKGKSTTQESMTPPERQVLALDTQHGSPQGEVGSSEHKHAITDVPSQPPFSVEPQKQERNIAAADQQNAPQTIFDRQIVTPSPDAKKYSREVERSDSASDLEKPLNVTQEQVPHAGSASQKQGPDLNVASAAVDEKVAFSSSQAQNFDTRPASTPISGDAQPASGDGPATSSLTVPQAQESAGTQATAEAIGAPQAIQSVPSDSLGKKEFAGPPSTDEEVMAPTISPAPAQDAPQGTARGEAIPAEPKFTLLDQDSAPSTWLSPPVESRKQVSSVAKSDPTYVSQSSDGPNVARRTDETESAGSLLPMAGTEPVQPPHEASFNLSSDKKTTMTQGDQSKTISNVSFSGNQTVGQLKSGADKGELSEELKSSYSRKSLEGTSTEEKAEQKLQAGISSTRSSEGDNRDTNETVGPAITFGGIQSLPPTENTESTEESRDNGSEKQREVKNQQNEADRTVGQSSQDSEKQREIQTDYKSESGLGTSEESKQQIQTEGKTEDGETKATTSKTEQPKERDLPKSSKSVGNQSQKEASDESEEQTSSSIQKTGNPPGKLNSSTDDTKSSDKEDNMSS